MLKKAISISLLGASIALTACQSAPTDDPAVTIETANILQLRQHTWVLSQLGNIEVTTTPNTRNIPSLQFSTDGRVSGADGCNRVMGSYTVSRDTLSLSQMASTRMACANKTYVPEKFNEALTKVTHYQVYGKTLKLLDRHGNLLLQFTSSIQPR